MTERDATKFTTGTVTGRRDFSDALWVVRIRPAVPIDFRAGQYVTVGVEDEGRLLERAYSIVSAPEEDEIELFLELVPEGLLTPHLYPIGKGDTVALRRRCKGVFLKACPTDSDVHLFVATVTGIAPFVSLLRHLIGRYRAGEWSPGDQRFLLLQGASRAHEFGYMEEMRAIAAEMPWFVYVPTVSRPWLDPEWDGERGRVEDVLRKHADTFGVAPEHASAYFCGHPGMIAGGRAILRRAGFASASIYEEQYWPEGHTAATP